MMDKNINMDSAIQEMYDTLKDAWALPLTNGKVIVERDILLSLLDEICAFMPEEIVKSKKVLASRDSVMSQAHKEAEIVLSSAKAEAEDIVSRANIEAEITVTKAKEKAESLVHESSVYKETQAQCKELLNNTNEKIAEMRASSNKYMDEALRATEESINESLRKIRDARVKLTSIAREPKKHSAVDKMINIDV